MGKNTLYTAAEIEEKIVRQEEQHRLETARREAESIWEYATVPINTDGGLPTFSRIGIKGETKASGIKTVSRELYDLIESERDRQIEDYLNASWAKSKRKKTPAFNTDEPMNDITRELVSKEKKGNLYEQYMGYAKSNADTSGNIFDKTKANALYRTAARGAQDERDDRRTEDRLLALNEAKKASGGRFDDAETVKKNAELINSQRVRLSDSEYTKLIKRTSGKLLRLEEGAVAARDFAKTSELGGKINAGELDGRAIKVIHGAVNGTEEVKGANRIYTMLNERERSIWNYYIAKGESDTALKYVRLLSDNLEERYAQNNAELLGSETGVGGYLKKAGAVALSGAESGVTDLMRTVGGVTDALGGRTTYLQNELFKPSVGEQLGGYLIAGEDSDFSRLLLTALNSAAYQIPSLAATAAGGGMLGFTAQSVGRSTAEGVLEGDNSPERVIYGIYEGVMEYATDRMLSGVAAQIGGHGTSGVTERLLEYIDGTVKSRRVSRLLKQATIQLGTMTSEAAEEFIQALAEPAARAVIYGEGMNYSTEVLKDALEASLIGGLSGLIMGIPTLRGVYNGSEAQRLGKQLDEYAGADLILRFADSFGERSTVEFTEVYEALKRGETPDYVTLARLYSDTMRSFLYFDEKDVAQFAESLAREGKPQELAERFFGGNRRVAEIFKKRYAAAKENGENNGTDRVLDKITREIDETDTVLKKLKDREKGASDEEITRNVKILPKSERSYDDVGEAESLLAERIAADMGYELKFERTTALNGEEVDGSIDIKKRLITVNPSANRPWRFVFKHELAHIAELEGIEYIDLQNGIMDSKSFNAYVRSRGFESVRECRQAFTETYGFTEDAEFLANCEMTADFVGDCLFAEDGGLERLYKELNRSARRTLTEWLEDVLSRIKAYITGKADTNAELKRIERKIAALLRSGRERVQNESEKEVTAQSVKSDSKETAQSVQSKGGKPAQNVNSTDSRVENVTRNVQSAFDETVNLIARNVKITEKIAQSVKSADGRGEKITQSVQNSSAAGVENHAGGGSSADGSKVGSGGVGFEESSADGSKVGSSGDIEVEVYVNGKKIAQNVQSSDSTLDYADYSVENIKYSQIVTNMNEEERAKILRETYLTAVDITGTAAPSEELTFDKIAESFKGKIQRTLFPVLRELGVFRQYTAKDIAKLSFWFTGGGGEKSFNSQITLYGGNNAEMVKVWLNLDKILMHAKVIEIHTDKAKGTAKENPELKQVYVLMALMKEGEKIIPVQLEVKEYKTGDNRLYLAVALNSFVLEDNKVGQRKFGVAEIVGEIATRDAAFFKYIPDNMLDEERLLAKEEALKAQAEKYGFKCSITVVPKNKKAARNVRYNENSEVGVTGTRPTAKQTVRPMYRTTEDGVISGNSQAYLTNGNLIPHGDTALFAQTPPDKRDAPELRPTKAKSVVGNEPAVMQQEPLIQLNNDSITDNAHKSNREVKGTARNVQNNNAITRSVKSTGSRVENVTRNVQNGSAAGVENPAGGSKVGSVADSSGVGSGGVSSAESGSRVSSGEDSLGKRSGGVGFEDSSVGGTKVGSGVRASGIGVEENSAREVGSVGEESSGVRSKEVGTARVAGSAWASGTKYALATEERTGKAERESGFYRSAATSVLINDRVKAEIAENRYIRGYTAQSNAALLSAAAAELERRPEERIGEFFALRGNPSRASAEDTATGFILLEGYQRAGDITAAADVAEILCGIGRASGQTVQLFSIMGRFSPEMMLSYADRELKRSFEALKAEKGKVWAEKNLERFTLNEEDKEFIRRRAVQAEKFDDGTRPKAILMAEICTRIQDKLPSTVGDKLRALQRISLLLNVKTNLRNLLGNVTMTPIFIASDLFGSVIDKAIATKTGIRTTAAFKAGLAPAAMKKGVYESIDDLKRGIRTKSEELNRFEVNRGGKSFSENGRIGVLNATAAALNRLDNFTGFCLELADRPFFELWFTESLNGQLRASGKELPTAEMVAIAKEEALRRTWQDENRAVGAVRSLKKTLNLVKLPGSDYGLGDFLIKFVKTPANIGRAMLEFSPMGGMQALTSGIRLAKRIKSGEATAELQRAFVRSLSHTVTGTTLYLLIALAAQAGLLAIKGGPDDDSKVNAFEKYVMGIAPYSAEIFGKRVTYSWNQPIGAIIAVAADFAASDRENGITERLTSAAGVWTRVFSEQMFISDICDVITDDDIFTRIFAELISDTAAFIPQPISQLASLGDKYRRSTYVKGDPIKSAINSIILKLPGLRENLPTVVSPIGEEVENAAYGNPFEAFIDPSVAYKASESEAGQRLAEEYRLYGKGIIPSIPKEIKVGDTVKALSAEERRKYLEAYLKERDRRLNGREWDELEESEQKAVKSAATRAAKKEIMNDE